MASILGIGNALTDILAVLEKIIGFAKIIRQYLISNLLDNFLVSITERWLINDFCESGANLCPVRGGEGNLDRVLNFAVRFCF